MSNNALARYVTNGGYKNLTNAIGNYKIPANRKQNRTNTITRRKIANGYNGMSEYNRIQANLRYDTEFIMNLIRLGVPSAKPTKKQRENNRRRATAIGVIKKHFVRKSAHPAAKNARKRVARERFNKYTRNLEERRTAAAATERARAAAQARANARSRVGTAVVSGHGRRQRVTVSGGQHTAQNAAPRATAPLPSGTLFRRAPNAGPLLSPSASAASQRTVNALVQAPSAGRGRAAPSVHSRLEKAMKGMKKH